MTLLITTETYQEAERRKVLNKAHRYAPDGVWRIKTPKKILRCDVCVKYRKRQAVYAHWQSQQLLCEDHVSLLPAFLQKYI